MSVTDVFKAIGSGISVGGVIYSSNIQAGMFLLCLLMLSPYLALKEGIHTGFCWCQSGTMMMMMMKSTFIVICCETVYIINGQIENEDLKL